MGNGITDFIDDNPNFLKGAAITVASLRLAAQGATGASKVVSLAAFGSESNSIDAALIALGLLGGAAGVAGTVTGVVKSIVDDSIHRDLAEVKAVEDKLVVSGIKSTTDYSKLAGASINAQQIANRGGTAWQHPNGIWVYLMDGKGRLVCDYEPRVAKTILQPLLPLRPTGNGEFKWTARRGGAG